MGQMKVRALQVCFIGGSLRKVGDEFMVEEDHKLRTKKRPPVLELVDQPKPEPEPPPQPANPSGKRRALKFENTPDED